MNVVPIRRTGQSALLAKVIEVANEDHDGHVTLLKFTSHWKGAFGTPDLYVGDGQEQIRKCPAFKTLTALLTCLLQKQPTFRR